MKFAVGDRVRIVTRIGPWNGKEGTVIGVGDFIDYYKTDINGPGYENGTTWSSHKLELIKSKELI